MSAGIRALFLIVPLVLFAVWGALHVPTPDDAGRFPGTHQDISLDAMPDFPRWASAELPDFASYQDVNEKKDAFFSFLYPRIVLANSRILIERQYLETLSRKEQLSESEKRWLEEQAERLRVDEEPGSDELFRRLRNRLDVIPPSLVMAQAANESAWGTSRFAKKGNNLFGQWCFSKGCGIVPKQRGEGKSHEVADFATPYRSIRSYIQNLNRHPSYQLVRDLRKKARDEGRLASGSTLAAGLSLYSERGEDYIKEIRSMIRFNKLARYDQAFRDAVFSNGTKALAQLASSGKETALLPSQAKADSTFNEG
ncbi:glucosaminidase domain-containing protein [Marinobacter sp. CHS3-4]|uniref:glucosaminidase domain-containing protein n=1 Tax=Marinobacter sp. CHS3-4 TaxID=3045174 RepID=UPI0024B4F9FF|nr:glucosaminidase domain-containing protein [Marinobacter sp. CHS3-4]MDI9244952.1 glucosaminidase domain-containing protein [Marinobacter sp. CHS3-4]